MRLLYDGSFSLLIIAQFLFLQSTVHFIFFFHSGLMQPRRIALQFTALCLLVSFCSKINILDHGIVWITLRVSHTKTTQSAAPLTLHTFLDRSLDGAFQGQFTSKRDQTSGYTGAAGSCYQSISDLTQHKE